MLLSLQALTDPDWIAQVRRGGPIVAVRLEAVSAGDVGRPLTENEQLNLARLFEINQVTWLPGDPGPEGGIGAILAGIAFDRAEYTLERQFAEAVHAWKSDLADESRLIDDLRLVHEMRHLMRGFTQLQWHRWDLQPWPAQQFIEASLRKARKRSRRRLLWGTGAVIAAVLAICTAVNLVPRLAQRELDNRAAIATIGDPELLKEIPDWSAAQAASLLLHGSVAQQELARRTLREALALPWSVGTIYTYPDASSYVLLNGGRQAAVIYREGAASSFALLQMPAGEVLWAKPLPALYLQLAASPDGSMALAVGAAGAVSIDIGTREVKPVSDKRLSQARLANRDVGFAISFDNAVIRLDLQSGTAAALGTFASVADLTVTETGAVLVLAETADRQIVLVNDGVRVLTVPSGALRAVGGGISPDGRQVMVPGADGQYWVAAAGAPLRPTGIVVPYLPRSLIWTTGDRVVILSSDRRGEVFYLPGAIPLGTVCKDMIRPARILVYPEAALVSCVSDGLHSVWRLPEAPVAVAVPAGSAKAGVSARADGRTVVISASGSIPETTMTGFKGEVTAVAVRGDGTQIVAGDSWGNVAIIEKGTSEWTVVVPWAVPGGAAVTAVGWGDGPLVATAAGHTWRAPECDGCATDEGLLRTFRERFDRCFTSRQLSYIDIETRDSLGIRVCGASLGRE